MRHAFMDCTDATTPRDCTSHVKSNKACISIRLFWMGVPLMMMRTATGISCRRCTSCILGFFTLWPYRAADALQAAGVHAQRLSRPGLGSTLSSSSNKNRTLHATSIVDMTAVIDAHADSKSKCSGDSATQPMHARKCSSCEAADGNKNRPHPES